MPRQCNKTRRNRMKTQYTRDASVSRTTLARRFRALAGLPFLEYGLRRWVLAGMRHADKPATCRQARSTKQLLSKRQSGAKLVLRLRLQSGLSRLPTDRRHI